MKGEVSYYAYPYSLYTLPIDRDTPPVVVMSHGQTAEARIPHYVVAQLVHLPSCLKLPTLKKLTVSKGHAAPLKNYRSIRRPCQNVKAVFKWSTAYPEGQPT